MERQDTKTTGSMLYTPGRMSNLLFLIGNPVAGAGDPEENAATGRPRVRPLLMFSALHRLHMYNLHPLIHIYDQKLRAESRNDRAETGA